MVFLNRLVASCSTVGSPPPEAMNRSRKMWGLLVIVCAVTFCIVSFGYLGSSSAALTRRRRAQPLHNVRQSHGKKVSDSRRKGHGDIRTFPPRRTLTGNSSVCMSPSELEDPLANATRHDIPPSFYTYHHSESSPDSSFPLPVEAPCDPFTVPFDPLRDKSCTRFLEEAAVNPSVWKGLKPLKQKFEQRTIKYKLTLAAPGPLTTIKALIKVPQVLFPLEPFSETTCYALDRALGIGRIPPTVLVAMPIQPLIDAASSVEEEYNDMVPEFLDDKHPANFTLWVMTDFVEFVTKLRPVTDEHGRERRQYMLNRTHVYVSVQLFMAEVFPLLSSVLRVPYSRKDPGWHRWFSLALPLNNYTGPRSSRLALSELAMFDYITLNNDRSPNKNNFVAGGCRKANHCRDWRRPSGLVPSFLHLDQGMAFYGFIREHNPIAKKKNSTVFCFFYAPLVRRLQCLHEKVAGSSSEGWESFFLSLLSPSLAINMGRDKIAESARQVPRLLKRVQECINAHNATTVLQEP